MAHQDVKRVVEASEYLQTIVPPDLQNPTVGIVCGSGLGGLAELLLPHPQVTVAYADIPHFANSTGDPFCSCKHPFTSCSLAEYLKSLATRESCFLVFSNMDRTLLFLWWEDFSQPLYGFLPCQMLK